jgi:hypothetical protein
MWISNNPKWTNVHTDILDKEIIDIWNSPEVAEYVENIEARAQRVSRNQYLWMSEEQLIKEKKVLDRVFSGWVITNIDYQNQIDLINIAQNNKESL